MAAFASLTTLRKRGKLGICVTNLLVGALAVTDLAVL